MARCCSGVSCATRVGRWRRRGVGLAGERARLLDQPLERERLRIAQRRRRRRGERLRHERQECRPEPCRNEVTARPGRAPTSAHASPRQYRLPPAAPPSAPRADLRTLSARKLRLFAFAPTGWRRLRLGARLGEPGRLVLGDQRLDDLVERLARDHLVELVEGQVDAVVGDAVLREIVGADALGAVAGADLAACGRRRARRRCAARSSS